MEINLTNSNFDNEVLSSDTPVLVDFWAPWCSPCLMVAPNVEVLAKEYAGKLKVCKLNVDEASEIATRYAVMSIPALVLFKKGEIAEKKVGVMSKEDLQKFIQPYV